MAGIPTWAEPTPYTSDPWPHTEGKSSAHCVIPSPQPMAASEPSSVLHPRTLHSPWLPASQAQHCIPVLSTAHGCQRAQLRTVSPYSPQPTAASEPSSALYPRTHPSPWLPPSQARSSIPLSGHATPYASSVCQLAPPTRHAPLGTGHRPVSNSARKSPQRAPLSSAMAHYASRVCQLAHPARIAPLGAGHHPVGNSARTSLQRARLSAPNLHYTPPPYASSPSVRAIPTLIGHTTLCL